MGETTDEDDLVDMRLIDLGVPDGPSRWARGSNGSDLGRAPRSVTGRDEGGVESDTFKEQVDLDGSLGAKHGCACVRSQAVQRPRRTRELKCPPCVAHGSKQATRPSFIGGKEG